MNLKMNWATSLGDFFFLKVQPILEGLRENRGSDSSRCGVFQGGRVMEERGRGIEDICESN